MQQLTANVCVETGFRGANVGYVTTEEGLVMIDAPFRPTDAIAWRKEVQSKGQVKYLINTEAHDDHYTGDFFFQVPVVAHEKTREGILAKGTKRILETIPVIDPVGLHLVDNYKLNVPAITFSEKLTLYLGKHSFHLIYLPGHTLSEIAILIPQEKVIFTGDNVTCRFQGFLHEADPFAWLESLKKIGELEFDHLVPGHGELCDKSYLLEQASYIQECIDSVKKAIERGWTKEETLARVSFQRFPLIHGLEVFGPGMLRASVARFYDLLSQK